MAAPRKIGKNANVFDLLGDLDDALEMAIEPVDPRSRSAQLAAAARSLKEPIIWIDCEMTGLDAQRDTILEIACVITDGKLNTTLEGPNIVIHHSDEVLAAMNAWCIDHHGKSGLTQRSRESSVSIQEAEERVLAFLTQHTKEQWAPLAGNSVHCDRQFLETRMPRVAAHLHFRNIDVSSLSELCRRWYKHESTQAPRKVMAHTALSDIRESIQELRYYRDAIFKRPK